MKTIYFVRHGSTDQLEARMWQHATAPLSDKGTEQAVSVARRFTNIHIDTIISSSLYRAIETAERIAEVTDKKVVRSDLFNELVRPSVILGKAHDDPEASAVYKIVTGYFAADSPKRYSDEENFSDLRERAVKALSFLAGYPADNICVVTHGVFLQTMVAVMIGGDDVSSRIASMIYGSFYLSNTGITKCTFQENRWVIRTWNDDGHLYSSAT